MSARKNRTTGRAPEGVVLGTGKMTPERLAARLGQRAGRVPSRPEGRHVPKVLRAEADAE